MNLFDLTLRFKGFPIKRAKLALKEIQQKNVVDFESYINTKRKDIIDYHLKHNRFYKSFAKSANSSNWNSIPVMTKRDLQQSLKTRLS